MTHFFYWDDWNLQHIAKHGVESHEAEHVIRRASRPYPRLAGKGKYQVKGRTMGGRRLQVIYVFRDAEEIDFSILTRQNKSR